MNLDFFRDLENNFKCMEVREFVNDFISDLTDYLDNFKEEIINNTKEIIDNQGKELNNLREENCLYQVVDLSSKGAYLQNTKNNIIFEETNIPVELKDIISNDYILRYKDGIYKFEEELTDDFFNKMVGIKEYQEIQEKFIKESNILEIDSNTRYNVLSREDNYTILEYENEKIEVPNALIPYFTNNDSILYYKEGQFYRDL